ncbi:MAG: DNRLRE domain-containing protein, partial [Clostridia bacterium]|nr:DNRLRE domain-containing protein [Clostridia bacterium]
MSIKIPTRTKCRERIEEELVKMKERFLAGLKKASVMIIASIMLLGVIPLGMLSHVTTVNAEGEFLRLAPETETSVAAENTLQGEGILSVTPDSHAVGGNYYGYLRFDLRSLQEKDIDEISSAKLRLILLRTPAAEAVPVQLWLMPDVAWSKSMDWAEKPSRLGEIPIASTTVSPETDGKSRLFEVDLTGYLKKWMEEGREKVSFRLDSLGDGIAAVYAGTAHEDPLFRPCLKVTTKAATDPDGNTLQKVRLSQQYATEQAQTTMMTVGGNQEVYLKFSLNTDNIQGAVYQTFLQLNYLQGDPEAMLRIDYLENTAWTTEELAEGNLPEGKRYPVYREEDFAFGVYDQIDMTDVVNDTLARGEREVTLLLWCENGKMVFESTGEQAPRLRVSVSDDRDVVAMMEASAGVLGKNTAPNAITKALADDGIADNGIRTEISWQAADVKTGLSARESLAANGKISRPQWFRESREILATATISAGEFQRERRCYLTILPQEIPDFTGVEFGTMLDIGAPDEEAKNKFESVGTVDRSRWIAGRKLTYRELKRDGTMILHFPVDEEKQNYLTVKLWEEDDFPGILVSSLQNREVTPFAIEGIKMAEREEGGFLYLTYPIPMSYTKDRKYVSLALTLPEQEIPEAGESVTAETEADESLEETPAVSIYDAYLTQTPYFDPLAFAEQGEAVVKKSEETESAFYRFLRKIYGAAEQTFGFRDT